jgi:hypothetical protein
VNDPICHVIDTQQFMDLVGVTRSNGGFDMDSKLPTLFVRDGLRRRILNDDWVKMTGLVLAQAIQPKICDQDADQEHGRYDDYSPHG